jgi:hypothetical protein
LSSVTLQRLYLLPRKIIMVVHTSATKTLSHPRPLARLSTTALSRPLLLRRHLTECLHARRSWGSVLLRLVAVKCAPWRNRVARRQAGHACLVLGS